MQKNSVTSTKSKAFLTQIFEGFLWILSLSLSLYIYI